MVVHLCSAAVECDFTCPACFSGLSPINICNQLFSDLSNSSLKADFLAKASHLSIIDQIIFYVELFETSIPDKAHIEATKHETTSHNHFLYPFFKKSQYDAKGEIILNKKNKPLRRLVSMKEQVDAEFLVKFLKALLPNAVHHRNMLRLYRNIKYAFADMMGFVYIDIDFSENLTMRIKFEPQLCHWSKL